MSLKSVTLVAIAGVCCSFALRTLGTLFPEAFANLLVVRIAVVANLLASVAVFMFFFTFWRQYPDRTQLLLSRVAALAAAGSLLVALLHLKFLLPVFNVHVLPALYDSLLVDAGIPLIGTLTSLFLVVVLYREARREARERLRAGARAAIIGFSIFGALQIVVLINYLRSGELQWMFGSSRDIVLALLPIVAIGFFALLYFFFSLYSELRAHGGAGSPEVS